MRHRMSRPLSGRVPLWLAVVATFVATCISSPAGATTTTYGVAKADLSSLTWDLPFGEPSTVDPPDAAFYSSALVASDLCTPLLRLNPNYSLSPNLATSYKQPNPLTLVFDLRQGVKFWNGSTMTSADVVWSLEQSAKPTTAVGFLYSGVKSITATGTYQVTVKFKHPTSLFLFEMATFVGMVQTKQFGEHAGSKLGSASAKIMCSGPYELTSWTPGTGMTLTANAAYWNPKYRAHAQTVHIDFDTTSASIAEGLTTGQLDGAYEVPPAIIPKLRAAKNGHLVFGAPSQLYLTLNVANPTGPLSDFDVRKALWMTIDRKAIADDAYYGAAIPNWTQNNLDSWDNGSWSAAARALFAGAYAGFEKQESSWGTPAAIAAAKSLATKGGYHGQSIVLATLAGTATLAEVAGLIQGEASEAGLNVKIKPLQPLTYTSASTSAKARVGIDLLLGSSFNNAPNPLEPMGLDYSPGDPYNYVNFHNPKVTKDITTALATSNQVKEAKLIDAAQNIADRDYWSQTLVQFDEIMFLKKGLGGATTSFAYMNEPALALIGKT